MVTNCILLEKKNQFKKVTYEYLLGVIHIVRTHKGEGRGQAKCVGLRTRGERGFQGCVRVQKNFLDQLFFCTKETIALPFIVYRKV